MERASSSSPYDSGRKGEVLLSFCDEDIGTSFASHLKSALNKNDIDTLRRHEIEENGRVVKCSVIIFSPNYAASALCLDEVVKILNWKETLGHKLIPIFYEVLPADVGKLGGSFGEAFTEHGQDSRAPRWREALANVAKISGKHFENRDEAEFVKEIVEEVSSKLTTVASSTISGDFSVLSSRVGVARLLASLSSWLTGVAYFRFAFFFLFAQPPTDRII